MNARLITAVITSLLDEAIIIGIILWGLPKLGINIPVWGTVLIALLFVVWAVTVFRLGTRILKKRPVPGLSDMAGTEGVVVRALTPDGIVKIDAELWEARANSGTISVGQEVVVVSQNRLKLVVQAKTGKDSGIS